MEQDTNLERRVSQLQMELERLTLALHQRAEDGNGFQPVEDPLSTMTKRCAEILDRWSLTDVRYTRAINEMETRLKDWGAIESRLTEDAERIQEFEKKIEHEWESLRLMFEQPVRQLQEHAGNLRETSVAAASSALSGMERAESKLTALQSLLSRQMGQLSREVHEAIAEMRESVRQNGSGQRSAAAAPAWPLERVMRLHDELRGTVEEGAEATEGIAGTAGESQPGEQIALPPAVQQAEPREPPASLLERIGSVEQTVSSGQEEVKEYSTRVARMRRLWLATLAAVAIGIIGVVFIGYRWQRQVEESLNEAAAHVRAAEQQAETARHDADAKVAATRDHADRQMAAALKSQVVAEVLVAPDVIRYSLVGGESAPGASARALWSRSRGLVVSGSRVPRAPAGSTYQLWFLTAGGPISAGVVEPDADGRLSFASENLPKVAWPVTGFRLTLESGNGSRASILEPPPPPATATQ